jgi:hypothetical protein
MATEILPDGHRNFAGRPQKFRRTAIEILPDGHENSAGRPQKFCRTATEILPDGHEKMGDEYKKTAPCQKTCCGDV